MLRITKIIRFETAHAIKGYEGACKNIHGHSYELHVTVSGNHVTDDYIGGTGFIIDFKDLKSLIRSRIIDLLDHALVLSQAYLEMHPEWKKADNLVLWDAEPTAENILLYIRRELAAALPAGISLQALKLYETAGSYAEWISDNGSLEP